MSWNGQLTREKQQQQQRRKPSNLKLIATRLKSNLTRGKKRRYRKQRVGERKKGCRQAGSCRIPTYGSESVSIEDRSSDLGEEKKKKKRTKKTAHTNEPQKKHQPKKLLNRLKTQRDEVTSERTGRKKQDHPRRSEPFRKKTRAQPKQE